MREIDKLIVHCSDSLWGNAAVIDAWHEERGWKGIGYHYVILNGYLTATSTFEPEFDGVIEPGRPEEEQGSHVKGMNEHTIGICLIGIDNFSKKQVRSLDKLLFYLCSKYDLAREDIIGHYETPTGAAQGKTCPNIDMRKYRSHIRWRFLMWAFGFFKPSRSDLISG